MRPCCSALCDSTAAKFDTARAARDLAEYRADGPGRTTRGLLEGLAAAGVQPRTLLDIGSGIGTLSFELLERGVATATCVDMSPAFVACGRMEAERRGIADRMSWRTADFVTVAPEVPEANLVTLDRVVCCYPAFQSLLQHAADHANMLLALSYPNARWYVHIAFAVENLVRRLRGSAFRAFVHPPAEMHALLLTAGFERLSDTATIMWRMDIYRRRPVAS
jgi:2-polyprenyl-3-methyl-5-hydroxy-6-metoxy-1,4-benzoquinol methylase